jgi:hypothetical protein
MNLLLLIELYRTFCTTSSGLLVDLFFFVVRLQEGMVITIEPGTYAYPLQTRTLSRTLKGIYVPPNANFPKQFHDIGIRIEVRILTEHYYS